MATTTGNKTWLYIGIAIVAILLFFPKLLKKLTGSTVRRRRARVVRSVNSHRRRVRVAITGRTRRPAGPAEIKAQKKHGRLKAVAPLNCTWHESGVCVN